MQDRGHALHRFPLASWNWWHGTPGQLRWAGSKGHEIVGQAVDLDVSGYKKAPWERPEIGSWLGQRAVESDIVAWARLDRAVRRMADMSRLAEWAKRERKTLAFCSGPGGTLVLDMSSGPVAELIAMVLAFAAELEAQSIQERVMDSRAYLRQVARWAGGCERTVANSR